MARPDRYRKKPVVIEAMRLEPGTDNYKDVCDWIATGVDEGNGDPVSHDGEGSVFIETLEGVMTASPGDYVIRGVQGEFYPCKPDIFDATYERASEEFDHSTPRPQSVGRITSPYDYDPDEEVK